jgi:hypothetical protein
MSMNEKRQANDKLLVTGGRGAWRCHHAFEYLVKLRISVVTDAGKLRAKRHRV